MSGEYEFEPVDTATKVTAIGYVEPQGFFKMADGLFTSMASRELEASLGHLKELLEVGADSLVLE